MIFAVLGQFGRSFIQLAAAVCRWDVSFQEIRYPLIGVDLVHDPGKAMAFVGVNLMFHHAAPLFNFVDHLQGLFLRAAGVVCTGQ